MRFQSLDKSKQLTVQDCLTPRSLAMMMAYLAVARLRLCDYKSVNHPVRQDTIYTVKSEGEDKTIDVVGDGAWS